MEPLCSADIEGSTLKLHLYQYSCLAVIVDFAVDQTSNSGLKLQCDFFFFVSFFFSVVLFPTDNVLKTPKAVPYFSFFLLYNFLVKTEEHSIILQK